MSDSGLPAPESPVPVAGDGESTLFGDSRSSTLSSTDGLASEVVVLVTVLVVEVSGVRSAPGMDLIVRTI